MFRVKIETGNDAFAENPSIEIARLLRKIASQVEEGRLEGRVMDINGNKVGEYGLK